MPDKLPTELWLMIARVGRDLDHEERYYYLRYEKPKPHVLKSLSLTSRHLHDITLPLIFEEVQWPNSRQRHQILLGIITRTPRVAEMVRKLTFTQNTLPESRISGVLTSTTQLRCLSIGCKSFNGALASIVFALPHLIRLELDCHRFSTTQASREIIATSKLAVLVLQNIGGTRFAPDFITNLYRFPHLRQLEVSESVIHLFFQCLKDSDTLPIRLETLVLQDDFPRVDTRDFVAFFKRHGSGLQVLSVARDREFNASLAPFLPSLRSFSGHVTAAPFFLTPLVDTICLTFNSYYDHPEPYDMSTVVNGLFNTAISPPRLRNLEVEVASITRPPMEDIFSRCPNLTSMKITIRRQPIVRDQSVSFSPVLYHCCLSYRISKVDPLRGEFPLDCIPSSSSVTELVLDSCVESNAERQRSIIKAWGRANVKLADFVLCRIHWRRHGVCDDDWGWSGGPSLH
jgi:hypothetical protein